MVVKTSCCRAVVRRRQRSGIGYRLVNTIDDGDEAAMTYKHEDQEVQGRIDRATTNEEVDLLEAVSFGAWLDLIPGIVNWLTECRGVSGWDEG